MRAHYLIPLVLAVACGTPKRGAGGDDDGTTDGGSTSCPSTCPDGTTCSNGMCKTPCEAALDHPSNVGCEFWAADLDNEATTISNAAAQQFSVVAANDNDAPVDVKVTINTARVGQPVSELQVA